MQQVMEYTYYKSRAYNHAYSIVIYDDVKIKKKNMLNFKNKTSLSSIKLYSNPNKVIIDDYFCYFTSTIYLGKANVKMTKNDELIEIILKDDIEQVVIKESLKLYFLDIY